MPQEPCTAHVLHMQYHTVLPCTALYCLQDSHHPLAASASALRRRCTGVRGRWIIGRASADTPASSPPPVTAGRSTVTGAGGAGPAPAPAPARLPLDATLFNPDEGLATGLLLPRGTPDEDKEGWYTDGMAGREVPLNDKLGVTGCCPLLPAAACWLLPAPAGTLL